MRNILKAHLSLDIVYKYLKAINFLVPFDINWTFSKSKNFRLEIGISKGLDFRCLPGIFGGC